MDVVTSRSKAHNGNQVSIRSQRSGSIRNSGHSRLNQTQALSIGSRRIASDVKPSRRSESGYPFSLSCHKPPRIDNFGYNKETHKGSELLTRNAPNALAELVPIPEWWQGKRLRNATNVFIKADITRKPTSG